MRGKGIWIIFIRRRTRITPAYAGKSAFSFFLAIFILDHPRLCGEKFPLGISIQYTTGSPPPMRGKVEKPLTCPEGFGITPAYAGKRDTCLNVSIPPKDHPRLCGEKFVYNMVNAVKRGSPPPMRGKGTISER